jgi:hypothetical protein
MNTQALAERYAIVSRPLLMRADTQHGHYAVHWLTPNCYCLLVDTAEGSLYRYFADSLECLEYWCEITGEDQ